MKVALFHQTVFKYRKLVPMKVRNSGFCQHIYSVENAKYGNLSALPLVSGKDYESSSPSLSIASSVLK